MQKSIGIPIISSWKIHIVVINKVIPKSGCNNNIMSIDTIDNIDKNKNFFLCVDFHIFKSQALIIIKKGFINSLGCNDWPKISIHLLAPLISGPYWILYNNAVRSNTKLISDSNLILWEFSSLKIIAIRKLSMTKIICFIEK